MKLQFDNEIEKPIYIQLAEQIEAGILTGIFAEETQIPSSTEISLMYRINPATINKGINLLVDEGLIYKKRGIGMFVSENAKSIAAQKRRGAFYEAYIVPLINEANNLGIREGELIDLIKNKGKKENGN